MLIAEIGNCHFGHMDKAKELIKAAHESGADLIKGQAFRAADLNSGSMPREFYEACQFSIPQYLELIQYARSIGNDLFYSIFSQDLKEVSLGQYWHKIAGSQTRAGMATAMNDLGSFLISVPLDVDFKKLHKFKKAELMYVSQYMTDYANLEHVTAMSEWLNRPVGYSDHTVGIDTCLRAYNDFGCEIIEKHFCLENDVDWNGVMFRDTVHGVVPREFIKLASAMK